LLRFAYDAGFIALNKRFEWREFQHIKRTFQRLNSVDESRATLYSPPFHRPDRAQEYVMTTLPRCPSCNSDLTYEDNGVFICPECAHEWSASAESEAEAKVYRDSAGNILQDGDTVTVIKDLKLKGSGGTIKMGTKVKNIRLVDSDHDIDCKIDGFGAMSLKSEFVRKA
jgi:protein PhnA